jgi:hypothetical protein
MLILLIGLMVVLEIFPRKKFMGIPNPSTCYEMFYDRHRHMTKQTVPPTSQEPQALTNP